MHLQDTSYSLGDPVCVYDEVHDRFVATAYQKFKNFSSAILVSVCGTMHLQRIGLVDGIMQWTAACDVVIATYVLMQPGPCWYMYIDYRHHT